MSKRVLVVDDALFMRMMLKDILVSNGYQVVGEASNADDAVAKYKELQPDLVTLDVVMPGRSGLQALTDILALNPNAVAVMVSAMGQETLMEEAKQLGAKAFIIKPFRPNAVASVLKDVVGE